MRRLAILLVLCGVLIVGCEQRRDSDDGKAKVKVNAPGVDVEVEGKKK